MNLLASIPSPPEGVWYLGPLPVRAYALCILAGIVVAVWIGNRRWVARGGRPGLVTDVSVWAVPFGIIGGRLYHLVTDWQIYLGEGGKGWLAMFRIWDGGLGIWGAVLLGGVGAWIGVRRRGIPLPPFADAIAPGIVIAQAMGRFGNYFNQELFGRPTDLPWGLEIDLAHRPPGYEQFATYHPTFLYESLWCLGVAAVVVWADRRYRMGHGRVFALYVMLYSIGRAWIESLRIDEAHHFFGIRLNVFTALVVALGALVYLVVSRRMRPGRETPAELDPRYAAGTGTGDGLEGAPAGGADATEDPDPDDRAEPADPDGPRDGVEAAAAATRAERTAPGPGGSAPDAEDAAGR
ncbi:MAG: prolipoprotein diacylglyceryl transferase [Frankiales bacterium]|nr:prolipoprotein diacylglyceryl transferase [Frankiales bacterium]